MVNYLYSKGAIIIYDLLGAKYVQGAFYFSNGNRERGVLYYLTIFKGEVNFCLQIYHFYKVNNFNIILGFTNMC